MFFGIILFLILYFEVGIILAIGIWATEPVLPCMPFPWPVVWSWGFRFLGEKIYNKIV